jgi:hypothetical protein
VKRSRIEIDIDPTKAAKLGRPQSGKYHRYQNRTPTPRQMVDDAFDLFARGDVDADLESSFVPPF